jgi:hypothetical protein
LVVMAFSFIRLRFVDWRNFSSSIRIQKTTDYILRAAQSLRSTSSQEGEENKPSAMVQVHHPKTTIG